MLSPMKIRFMFWSNIQGLDLGTSLQFELGVHFEEVVHGFPSPTARLTFLHLLLSSFDLTPGDPCLDNLFTLGLSSLFLKTKDQPSKQCWQCSCLIITVYLKLPITSFFKVAKFGSNPHSNLEGLGINSILTNKYSNDCTYLEIAKHCCCHCSKHSAQLSRCYLNFL